MNQSPYHDAYDQCCQSEIEAGTDAIRLMYARRLGYLILEAPNPDARNIIAEEVLQCMAGPGRMDELAEFYINHLFLFFKQNKGCTPALSEHPSRPSSEIHRSFFGVAIDTAPRDHLSAKKAGLRRDAYRCMVTHSVDRATFREMTVAERAACNMPPGTASTTTNFCYIFPPSTNWGLNKTHYSRNVWSVLSNFGGIDVLAELDGDKIHRLYNGLTLALVMHPEFADLELWFEEVPNQLNTYTVCALDHSIWSLSSLPYPCIVTFTSTSDELELPDPRYLKLHAAVCRVAHMSGVAGYLNLCDREVEERGVLSPDGSSADLLTSRIQRMLHVR